MSIAIVTGSCGLIGSEMSFFLLEKGFDVIGIDNDMRSYFFGAEASTKWNLNKLTAYSNFINENIDIRNSQEINNIFKKYGTTINLIIHTAAQPSHDWASKEPLTDFTVNANGTLNILEATRLFCPNAVFIFTSTNKVYGDLPNYLPIIENKTRWEIDNNHKFSLNGIDETMSIDQSKHSLFGASKVAADVLVQEYGRYFGIRTAVFRGGCLTGPAHSGAELHGFLAYLIKCIVTDKTYTIFGYNGKQVRDNIHSKDLINAFWEFYNSPDIAQVYNIGGSRHSNISMIEAINFLQNYLSKELKYTLNDNARQGDHIWYISDVSKFRSHYPNWTYTYTIEDTIKEMVEATKERYK
jgi:CDP-paratose 2-epimerase